MDPIPKTCFEGGRNMKNGVVVDVNDEITKAAANPIRAKQGRERSHST